MAEEIMRAFDLTKVDDSDIMTQPFSLSDTDPIVSEKKSNVMTGEEFSKLGKISSSWNDPAWKKTSASEVFGTEKVDLTKPEEFIASTSQGFIDEIANFPDKIKNETAQIVLEGYEDKNKLTQRLIGYISKVLPKLPVGTQPEELVKKIVDKSDVFRPEYDEKLVNTLDGREYPLVEWARKTLANTTKAIQDRDLARVLQAEQRGIDRDAWSNQIGTTIGAMMPVIALGKGVGTVSKALGATAETATKVGGAAMKAGTLAQMTGDYAYTTAAQYLDKTGDKDFTNFTPEDAKGLSALGYGAIGTMIEYGFGGVEALFANGMERLGTSSILKAVGKTMAGEAWEEFLQEWEEFLFRTADGTNTRTWGETLKDSLKSAVYGGLIGGVIGDVAYRTNRRNIANALMKTGMDYGTAIKVADAVIEDTGQEIFKRADENISLTNKVGESFEKLQGNVKTALETAGWMENIIDPTTQQPMNIDTYSRLMASDIASQIIRQASLSGLSPNEFMDVSQFQAIDNVIYLKPLGSKADIKAQIDAQDAMIKRQRELKKTGAEDSGKLKLAQTRKNILQKAYNIKEYQEKRAKEQIKAQTTPELAKEIETASNDVETVKGATQAEFESKTDTENITSAEKSKRYGNAVLKSILPTKTDFDAVMVDPMYANAKQAIIAIADRINSFIKAHRTYGLKTDIANALKKMQTVNQGNFIDSVTTPDLDGVDVIAENAFLYHFLFSDATTIQTYLDSYITRAEESLNSKNKKLIKKDLVGQSLKATDNAMQTQAQVIGAEYTSIYNEDGSYADKNVMAVILSYQNQFVQEQGQQVPPQVLKQFDLANENARLDDIYPAYDKETIVVDGVERTVYNSEGKRINKSAEALTNFWRWFGDSKVVDKKGRPIVMHHGSKTSFDEFYRSSDIGFHFGSKGAARIKAGRSKQAVVYNVYLKIQNPLKFDRDLGNWDAAKDGYLAPALLNMGIITKEQFDALRYSGGAAYRSANAKLLRDALQEKGYDGIEYPNYYEDTGKISYVAFEPTQIKSTENSGAFSSSTGNIYYQDDPFSVAEENARLDDIYPAYDGDSIEIFDYDTNAISDWADKNIEKQDSFETDEGVFTNYKLVGDNRNMPTFTVFESKDGWIVRNAYIPESEQNKGIGTKFYQYMNEQSIQKTGNPLRSTQPRKLTNGKKVFELSDLGKKLWESLVKKGLATKNKNGTYKFNRPQQRTVYNSEGKRINKSAEALTNFWRWFGDSKVVDEQGRPIVMYHGTSSVFDTFDKSSFGTVTDSGFFGTGFYFTPIKSEAEYYGRIVMPVYLKIEKPFVISTGGYYSGLYDNLFEGGGEILKDLGLLSEKDLKDFNKYQKLKNEFLKKAKVEKVYTYDAQHNEVQVWSASFEKNGRTYEGKSYRPWDEVGYNEKEDTKENALNNAWGEYAHFNDLNFLIQDLSFTDYIRTNGLSEQLSNIIKSRGYDGTIAGDEHIVFEPTQIKSVDNRGTYSEKTGNILYQDEEDKNLVITHGISVDKLEKALKLGGLPVPSIAISKISEPLTNFGAIKLVGTKDIVRFYFEAKPQRVVSLNEFAGAVVPTDERYNEISAKLSDRGLYVVRTDNLQDGIINIENLSGNVLFQGKQANGFYDPELSVILLGKNWNTMTLPHELAHYWLDTLFSVYKRVSGGELKANAEWLQEKKDMFVMLGIDENQEKLTAGQQEKFARMVESYLTGIGVSKEMNQTFKEYFKWVPEKYKSILQLGYLDDQGKIQYPFLDQASVDFFNRWYENASLPSLPTSPERQRFMNATGDDGQTQRVSIKEMNDRQKEFGQDAEEQIRTDERLYNTLDENMSAETKPVADAQKVVIAERGNFLKESEKQQRRWYERKSRDTEAQLAQDYIEKNPDHAKEVIFGDPELVPNDTGIDRATLINAYMALNNITPDKPEWATLHTNIAINQSLAGTQLALSNDKSYGTYLDALREVENALELKAATNYAGSKQGARERFNADIQRFLDRELPSVFATSPNSKERETALKMLFEKARTTFSGNTTGTFLNQVDLDYAMGQKGKTEAFMRWATNQIKKDAGAKLNNEQQAKLLQLSAKAQQALIDLDNPDADKAVAAAQELRKWQVEKDKLMGVSQRKFSLFGDWAPRAMLASVNTLVVANVPSTAINTAVTNLAKRGLTGGIFGEHNVSKNLVDKEVDRIKRIWWATGMNLAQMEKPTSPSLLHGEKYSASGQKIYDPYTILGWEDNYFRVPTFVNTLARIASTDAKATGRSADEVFREYASLNNQSDAAKLARKQALAVANMAVFTQDGALASCLNHIRSELNRLSRVMLGLDPKGFGLGNLLAPFLTTGANIAEMGIRGSLAPITTITSLVNSWRTGKTIDPMKKLALRMDWAYFGLSAVAMVLLAALTSDDDEFYADPYVTGKKYDPNKPYDSINIGGVWLDLDFFGPFAIPMRTAAKVIQAWEKDNGIGAVLTGYGASAKSVIGDIPLAESIINNQVSYAVKKPSNWGASYVYNQANKLVPAIVKPVSRAVSRGYGLEYEGEWLGTTVGRKFHRNYGFDGLELTTQDLIEMLTTKVQLDESINKKI